MTICLVQLSMAMDNFHSETIIFFINLGNIKIACDDHSHSLLQMLDE